MRFSIITLTLAMTLRCLRLVLEICDALWPGPRLKRVINRLVKFSNERLACELLRAARKHQIDEFAVWESLYALKRRQAYLRRFLEEQAQKDLFSEESPPSNNETR